MLICCDESCLIASTFLQTQRGARSITVEYRVEFPDATCSNATPPFPLTLTTERFSNVLTVMERAADVGSSYRFSATYFSNTALSMEQYHLMPIQLVHKQTTAAVRATL